MGRLRGFRRRLLVERTVGSDIPEAAGLLDAYFVAFPTVKEYMEDTVGEARECDCTEFFGRRSKIPELVPNIRQIGQAGLKSPIHVEIILVTPVK